MIELVWDATNAGTATTPTGAVMKVGDDLCWSAQNLLALSAATCLMQTTLRLAAEDHLPVLGYVAAARVEPDAHARPAVTIRACVVVPPDVPTDRVRDLCERGRLASPIASMLGDRLCQTPEISRVERRLTPRAGDEKA